MTRPRPGHVWVILHGATYAGLALQWRRSGESWEALTTYADSEGVVITQWLPQAQLEPVPGTPYTGSQYG